MRIQLQAHLHHRYPLRSQLLHNNSTRVCLLLFLAVHRHYISSIISVLLATILIHDTTLLANLYSCSVQISTTFSQYIGTFSLFLFLSLPCSLLYSSRSSFSSSLVACDVLSCRKDKLYILDSFISTAGWRDDSRSLNNPLVKKRRRFGVNYGTEWDCFSFFFLPVPPCGPSSASSFNLCFLLLFSSFLSNMLTDGGRICEHIWHLVLCHCILVLELLLLLSVYQDIHRDNDPVYD